MIKIQTERPVIPIEIGELKFEFSTSDESIKNLRENAAKVKEELDALKFDENDDNVIEQAKDVLERAYGLILGKGSFEKVYNLSPSVVICMKYFSQIVEGIEQELRNMGLAQSQREKAQKYLTQKK